jgi:hypothetical protein
MRIVMGVSVAVAAIIGAVVGVSAAQAPVPTVTITAAVGSVSAAPTPVAPGATRFEFVSTEQNTELGVFVAALKPGITADAFVTALKSDPESSLALVDMVASATVAPGGRRAVTGEIKADTTYMLINDGGSEDPAKIATAPLATGGAPTGATLPAPDAEIRLRDLRFLGDRVLPRNGVVRVSNIGWAPHFAFAARLKRTARQKLVARALVGNRERALGRLLDFRSSVEVSNILTRGSVTNQEVRFSKRGRYVLACFFENHNAQGMYRFVRVR